MEACASKAVAEVDSIVMRQTQSGTTAVFVLKVDQQILVGHLGDSKAFLCQWPASATTSLQSRTLPSKSQHAQHEAAESTVHRDHLRQLRSLPLTLDHSPDRADEAARIDAAGGFVSKATAGDLTSMRICSQHGLLNISLGCIMIQQSAVKQPAGPTA